MSAPCPADAVPVGVAVVLPLEMPLEMPAARKIVATTFPVAVAAVAAAVVAVAAAVAAVVAVAVAAAAAAVVAVAAVAARNTFRNTVNCNTETKISIVILLSKTRGTLNMPKLLIFLPRRPPHTPRPILQSRHS